jgi:hypothetical protein
VSECPAGCCPHDGVSLDKGCQRDLPDAPLPERVAHLRACQLLPVAKIAAVTGLERRYVIRLLFEAVTEVRPSGVVRWMRREAADDEWLDDVMAHLSSRERLPASRTEPPAPADGAGPGRA